jgi:hypothetical protein
MERVKFKVERLTCPDRKEGVKQLVSCSRRAAEMMREGKYLLRKVSYTASRI